MKKIVIISQHRNQVSCRSEPLSSDRLGSLPSSGFKGINCRTFQSSNRVLSSPVRIFSSSDNTPEPKGFRTEPPKLTRRSCPISTCPKPLSKISNCIGDSSFPELRAYQLGNGDLPSSAAIFHSYSSTLQRKGSLSEPPKPSKRSNAISISPKPNNFSGDLTSSELWAGPTYSNSPPPSSLPMPKFSLHQKRSISLDLPNSISSPTLQLESKSAPASPARDSRSPSPDFFLNTASATENLRRILNLDLAS